MITSSHAKPAPYWSGLIVATVTLLHLTGCTTYHPTVTAPNQAAEVRGSLELSSQAVHTPEFWRIYLVSVDGAGVRHGSKSGTEPIRIDPGQRVLTVRARSPRTTLSDQGQVALTANLQAGHAYQLQFHWRPGLMTFWVEDMATHAEVSNRKWLSPAYHGHPKINSILVVPSFKF